MRNSVLAVVFGVLILLVSDLSPAIGQSNGQGPKMETEILELSRHGFLPKKITRPAAGKHYLYIRNITGLDGLTFQVQDNSSAKAQDDMTLKPGQHRLVSLVDLKPGQYHITVVNHPEWTADIVIGGN
jgi:hypothetical protein